VSDPIAPGERNEQRIEKRASFELIRYANCWEDADILCEALRPAPGKRILAIASAGDNALALLAGGAEVLAVDLSLPQLACVEIRKAGFRRLEHAELLAFLGVTPATDRLATYARLAHDLTPAARGFWDKRTADIARGLIQAGKFEDYFKKFREWVLPWIHKRPVVAELLKEKDQHARQDFFDKRWNTSSWQLVFRVFFSRFFMGRLGRDPEFFRYVEGSVSERILDRTRHALTALPTHANPYLQFILNGNYGPALPRYLRPEHFAAIREGLDRLTLFQGPIDQAARQAQHEGFDGFNLSDIFEYLDPTNCREVYQTLLDRARPGARFAYWNMLVPRNCPPELASRVTHLKELSQELYVRDLAFFYSAFVVEEVR